MIQTVQTGRFEPTDTKAEKTLASLDRPSATAGLIALEQGLYVLEIGETRCVQGAVSGLQLPAVQVSAPSDKQDSSAEIIGKSGRSDTWLGPEGGTVVIKSPAGGAHVFVTIYGLPAQRVPVPDVQVRRLGRLGSNEAARRSVDLTYEPEEILCEIVLHMERLGDRALSGRGLGRQSRQEAADRSI